MYGKGSVWAELEGARTTHQGTPNRITDLHEKDVSHVLAAGDKGRQVV